MVVFLAFVSTFSCLTSVQRFWASAITSASLPSLKYCLAIGEVTPFTYPFFAFGS